MAAQENAGFSVDHDVERVALLPLEDDLLVRAEAAFPGRGKDLIHEPRPQGSEDLAFEEDLARSRVGGKLGRHRR